MKIKHNEPYEPLRASAYMSMGEQMDAIYKGFKALREQGIPLPQETLDWLTHIEQVKSTFTKPTV